MVTECVSCARSDMRPKFSILEMQGNITPDAVNTRRLCEGSIKGSGMTLLVGKYDLQGDKSTRRKNMIILRRSNDNASNYLALEGAVSSHFKFEALPTVRV